MKCHLSTVSIAMRSRHLVTCWTFSQRTLSPAPALPPQAPWALGPTAVERLLAAGLPAELVNFGVYISCVLLTSDLSIVVCKL